jgi:hypothetical protein
MSDSLKAEGAKALEALDRALAHRPKRDGEAFSETTEHLCRMRDLLIGHCRAGAGLQDKLDRLNAVISSSLAGHFPLGNTPWPEVEKARDALRSLVTDLPR